MNAKNAGDKTESTTHQITEYLCRRVRELRRQKGWSLDALSQASGVSRSMLSQVERNQANPTLAVTMRIVQVIRADDTSYHYRSEPDCRIRTLSPLHLEKDVEFYEVELLAGGSLVSSPHFEGTREFLTVQKGRIKVRSGEEAATLGKGDSCSYRADLPHAIENTGRGIALLFLVDIYA
jgi:transcriptional regulator with XRE-family HTH domain